VTDRTKPPGGEPEPVPIDFDTLRTQVRSKYRDVACDPHGEHHFHTGRRLARLLGYPPDVLDELPEPVVESFAGVANPFSLRRLVPGERVVDVGSGAGLDSLVAARESALMDGSSAST
jgi:hypothetical protein